MLRETAYAKINLALHVRKRREDGYHELETLFAFANHGDVLTAESAEGLSLEIMGPFATSLSAGDDNLVLKAAKAMRKPGLGAHLVLEKNLPVASGIGGGSADAAAALRLLLRLWAGHVDLMPIAASLGADVPACLVSQTVIGEGNGEKLTPFNGEDISGTPILLVNPGVPCPTGPVFAAWDRVDRGPLDPANWQIARNDLQTPATRLIPAIGEVLAVLEMKSGATLARMSGSGATGFALFESEAQRDAACAMITAEHPDWWTMAALLR